MLLEILDELNYRNIKFALSNMLEHKAQQNEILKKWLKNSVYYVHTIHSNYTNSNYQTKKR